MFPKMAPRFGYVCSQTADPKVAPDDPQKWTPQKKIRAQVSVWQRWVKWLKQVALADEDLVLVNMDETAVQHEYQSRAGNSVILGRRTCSELRWCEERVHRAATRAHCTLVAFVTDDADLQKKLPQIFLPATKTRALSRVEQTKFNEMEKPLEYWVGTGGWVTAEIFKRILTKLRAACRQVRGNARILLWMDAASQHVGVEVLNHAARLHIYLVLVPAGLTWLMQPLDVYVFAKLKTAMRDGHRNMRAGREESCLAAGEWISVTSQAVRSILVDTDWSMVFGKLGMGPDAGPPNDRLRRYMQPAAEVEARPPNDADMEELLGRHRVDMARRFVDGPTLCMKRRADAAAAGALPVPPHEVPARPHVVRAVRLGGARPARPAPAVDRAVDQAMAKHCPGSTVAK